MSDAGALWIAAACIAVNGALIAWNVRTGVRLLRERKAAMQANELLMRLCLQAFHLQHLPIWLAWQRTLGDISVNVTASPHWPGE